MNPLARDRNDERIIYDCSRGPPPPYPTSKSNLDDSTCAANRTFVHPGHPYPQYNTSSKPVENALQAFNQMIGTVQPMAQAQAYKPQQVLSSIKANSQAQNTLVYEVVSQPTCHTIVAPRRQQATIHTKDHTVTNKGVQQFALNGLVWMTTTGQSVQTANNVHNIHSTRMMQAFNPVVAYQNQNVGHSSKTLISVTSANESVPQISMGQGHVNVSESEGNRSSALMSVIANDYVKCNDQIQIQAAYGKMGVDQDPYKAPSNVASNTSAQLCQRNWPALTNCLSRPALTYGTQTRVDSSLGILQASERTGSLAWLSSQQSVQHNTTNSWSSPTNSSGQKRMVLARVTPMSHDWRNLQQNPQTFPSANIYKLKSLHVENTQLHHKEGSGQQSRTSEEANSTSEKSVEKKNNATMSSTAGINTRRNIPLAPAVPPLTFKPSLYRQQNVHNIHYFYTPTINEHSLIPSPIAPSDLNAQHNVTAPGNHISTTKASSQNTVSVASQLSPLSVGHCNFGVSSISSSNSITQQTVTTSAVGVGSLYNNGEHQSTLPPSDLPHSVNVLYSTISLASKDVGKQTIQFIPSGSNPPSAGLSNDNPVPSPIHLSSRGDYGKPGTAGLVLVIPPAVVVHNCKNMQGSSVYSPSTISTYEKNMPVRLTEDQGETSNSVMEVTTSVSEKSKNSSLSVANPSSSTRQQCEEMLGISAPPVGGFSEQQTHCVNPPLVPNEKSPTGVLPSSTELNGKKRNLILDTGTLSEDSSSQHDLMSCDGRENLTVIESPPQKRFLASALEDTSRDANGCKNALPCVNKIAINSPKLATAGLNIAPCPSSLRSNSFHTANNKGLEELVTRSESPAKNEATIADQTVARDGAVEPEIYITGVFSLGDSTELWGSARQSSPCSLVDLTSTSTEVVNNSSATKGSVAGESSLKDKVSHVEDCNTLVVQEIVQTVCVPPSNLESRQCSSRTESPKMVHARSVLESSLLKNIDQLSCESDKRPADILIDLTADKDDFTEPPQTDSVLPSDFKEQEEKLVSDSVLPVEINGPSPLKPSEKETQDLDGLLHSVDTAIESLLNFWNPYPPTFVRSNTGKLACKHYNLQEGETCECKLPNIAKETALTSFEEVHVPDEGDKAGLHENSDCNSSYNIKVLGHTEILNLLDEISKSMPSERLPTEGAGPVVRLSEEMQNKASQNTSSDGCKDSSSKAMEMKPSARHGDHQNPAPPRSHCNKSSTAKKGRQQEKKEYCCINAWLVASGVLGIYCHCKLSQGNKAENQADLPNAVHETQNSNETSNPNCIPNQMEIETILDSVPIATYGKHVLEVSENWNSMPRSCSSIVPDRNQEKVTGELQQEVYVVEEAIQHSSEGSTRVVKENEIEGLCKPNNTNLNLLNTSEELKTDKLACKVTLERKFDQKKTKENSQDVVEIEPDKETCTVLEKELNEDKMKNVSRDLSQNVLNEETSDQTDTQKVKRHLGVKLGFKVMKRKPDGSNCRSPQKKRKCDIQGKKRKPGKSHSLQKNSRSPQKKMRCDVEGAKLLPNYNCHVMIRDKTYSSSGERAVLVSLLPISGQPCRAREKVRAKPQ